MEHYNAIMIEEIRSVVRTELEGMHIRMDSFERRMGTIENRLESFRVEVNGRFNMVEAAIKCNADGIRELRSDMRQVNERLSRIEGKMDSVSNRVDEHEERFKQLIV